MNKRILLIGESNSKFILNAIKEALRAEGFETELSEPEVNELSRFVETGKDVDAVVLYGGEYIDHAADVLVYLKDMCSEYEKKLYLIGYNNEIETIRLKIPAHLIAQVFERPLNVKVFAERLLEDMRQVRETGDKKHILVVDDSGMMLRTIRSWLKDKYRVSMASSGAMAFSFLANNKPDLILLDYEMPICSGPQFMEMLHAEVSTQDIPVIFLTAKGDRESVEKVLSLKPSGYLLKTMPPEEIVSSIDKYFEKRKGYGV